MHENFSEKAVQLLFHIMPFMLCQSKHIWPFYLYHTSVCVLLNVTNKIGKYGEKRGKAEKTRIQKPEVRKKGELVGKLSGPGH